MKSRKTLTIILTVVTAVGNASSWLSLMLN